MSMGMGRLQGKIAVIAGGAFGIGAAAARRFAKEGATVVLADAQPKKRTEIAEVVGGLFVELDVAEEAGWRGLMAAVVDRYGGLDLVFNNAGIVSGRSIEDVDLETWNTVIGVNLTGVMLACKHGIAPMRRNPGGSIGSRINTASRRWHCRHRCQRQGWRSLAARRSPRRYPRLPGR